MLRFTPKANRQTKRFAQRLQHVSQRAIRQSFFELGHKLKKDAQDEILHGKKTGKVYRIRRGRRIKNHQASAAGESPANLSGALRRGINFTIQGSDKLEWGYTDSTPYGLWLELGTSKMDARPNIVPVSEKNNKEARTYFYQALDREQRKVNDEIRRLG